MKLTQDQIDNIYKLYSWYDSQRYIAKRLGHSRGTIARHLNPIAIIEHFHAKEYEVQHNRYELEEKVSNYQYIAIFSLLLVTIQTLINFFY